MPTIGLHAAIAALALVATPALASNGGDRSPAGGAFMSSYSNGAGAPRAQQPAPAWDGAFRPGRDDVRATGSVPRQRNEYRR